MAESTDLFELDTLIGISDNAGVHLQPDGALIRLQDHSHATGYHLFKIGRIEARLCQLLRKPQTCGAFLGTVQLIERDNLISYLLPTANNFLVSGFRNGWLTNTTTSSSAHIHGRTDIVTPMHASIELTDFCNHGCTYCYRESSAKCVRFWDTDALVSLLHNMAKGGVLTVELTGGEPTLHPNFSVILRNSLDLFCDVAIISNGWGLNEKVLGIIEQQPEKVMIQIDLDGPDSAMHDRIRNKKGSFDRAYKAATILAGAGIPVRVCMNLVRDNMHCISETCERALSTGARWFAISPTMQVGRNHETKAWEWDEFELIHKQAEECKRRHGESFYSKEVEGRIVKEFDHCGAGVRSVAIGPDGNVRPCVMTPVGALSCGTVASGGFDELVEEWGAKRSLHAVTPPGMETCSKCPNAAVCAGCLVRPFDVVARCQAKDPGFECGWMKKYAKELGIEEHAASRASTPALAVG